MHDLKRLEEKFHEYLRARLDENYFRIDEIKLTEDLFGQQEAFYMPFGWISYFLAMEDGRPVVYANACSRMDLDVVAFIDEDGFEDYDVWDSDPGGMGARYASQARKVKRFNYDDLKFISDVER